jgi:DNA polymerase
MVDSIERPGAEEWIPADASLTGLRHAAPDCRGCELWKDATHVVFSTGSPGARLMLIGEQPGDQEDHLGKPFVGPAGQLLNDAMAAADIDAGDVYLTNAVKHFRFEERGKRRLHKHPDVAHIVACHPWLSAEVAVVRPQVIVCLGASAGHSVLGRPVSIARERGRFLPDETGLDARILLTTHPSAVLRLRGRDGYDEAFDTLVADLAKAAAPPVE